MPNSRPICRQRTWGRSLGSSKVVLWPIGRDWGWGSLILGRYLTCLWGERRLVLGWSALGIPSHASRAPQPNPNLLSLLSLQIHTQRGTSLGLRCSKAVECWRKLLINSHASTSRPAFYSFPLVMNCVTSSVKRNDFGMTWLQNDVIRHLNSGLWALKKKEERTSLRPFFDTSKRLSYFYLSTMNIFVDFRELSWCCF